jgi:hypothetical protein
MSEPKKLIDEETLKRLIDETREDVERHSIMNESNSDIYQTQNVGSVQLYEARTNNLALQDAQQSISKVMAIQSEMEMQKEETNEEEEKINYQRQLDLIEDLKKSN